MACKLFFQRVNTLFFYVNVSTCWLFFPMSITACHLLNLPNRIAPWQLRYPYRYYTQTHTNTHIHTETQKYISVTIDSVDSSTSWRESAVRCAVCGARRRDQCAALWYREGSIIGSMCLIAPVSCILVVIFDMIGWQSSRKSIPNTSIHTHHTIQGSPPSPHLIYKIITVQKYFFYYKNGSCKHDRGGSFWCFS